MTLPRAACALLAAIALAPSSTAQGFDPRGIYFNDYVGPFDGTEWFQVTPVGTSTTTYNIRDIFGGGFTGTIDSSGNIVIPGIPMDGSFSDADNFVIFPFNGAFTFTSNRAATTGPGFPLRMESPEVANPLLAGQWRNTLRFFDPQSGQPGAPATEIVTLSTAGNTLRITDPAGLFFQGVFENGLQAGFRVLNNPNFGTPTGDFAPFPGSSTNIGQDLLGELNMVDINHFRASFLLQTRTPLGSQDQALVEFEAERLVPLATGDANGDGSVDASDEALVASLQGLTFEDSGYNLAADINADGVIDATDLAFYQQVGTTYCGPAAPNSTGSPGLLSAEGSAVAADNDLTLLASNLPANLLVLGITSQTQGFVPMAGGSMGNLCLSGSFGRFISLAGLSSPTGTFAISADLGALPQPVGTVAVVAGETWNFQAWHRDVVAGQGTSNFTAGLSILFQ